MRKITQVLSLIMILTLSVGLSACSKKDMATSTKSSMSMDVANGSTANNGLSDSKAKENSPANPSAQNTSDNKNVVTENRKLIKNVDIMMQTTEFDKSISKIDKIKTDYNGYVESSNISGNKYNENSFKSAKITLKIPKDNLDKCLNELGSVGNIVTKNISTKDVTDSYFDIEARLSSLKVQQDRLLEILKKATTLEDIIKLEQELQKVRYEIENLTGTLKKYDGLVDYATINISIDEVKNITSPVNPHKLGDRVKSTFKSNINGLSSIGESIIVFFIGNSPTLIILGVLSFVGIFVYKKKYKKNNDSTKKD